MEYVNDRNLDDSLWTNKYSPKIIEDIIGCKEAIKMITEWLDNFEKNKELVLKEIEERRKKSKNKGKKIRIGGGRKKSKNLNLDNSENDISQNFDNNAIDDIDNNAIDDIDGVDDIENVDLDNIDDIDGIDMNNEKEIKKNDGKPKSSIIVTGSHGCGKTCVVNAILKSKEIVKQTINFSKIKNASDIKDVMSNFVNNKNILTIIKGTQNERVVMVIDEIEGISGSGKNCVTELLKNNIEKWVYPIIFISNGQHNKLLTEIKKNSHEIKIKPPTRFEMLCLLERVIKREKMSIEGMNTKNNDNNNGNNNSNINNYNIAYEIINHSQNDYRRLIMTLHDLYYLRGRKIITSDILEEYMKLSKKKDQDFQLFRSAGSLLKDYNGIDECIRYYEIDKVVLPLMIQQNYIEYITKKTNDKTLQFELASCISTLLSDGDVIENYIYGDQNWDIHEVHGYYTCVAPSYLISTKLKNSKVKYIDLGYPTDLNKASISKINKKNIVNASKAFKNKNINDYIYINMILKLLMNNDDIKKSLGSLLRDYDINVNQIDILAKVDKIKPSKFKSSLTNKQKKEISDSLETKNTKLNTNINDNINYATSDDENNLNDDY